MNPNKKYLEATVWAADEVEQFVVGDALDFPETTFADVVLSWADGVRSVQNELGATTYEVSLDMGEALRTLALQDAEFFDACIEICASNAGAHERMPAGLAVFASGVLRGMVKRPTPKHRQRQKKFLEVLFLLNTVQRVRSRFDLTETRNDDEKRSDSACDVVSGALATCGVNSIKYATLKELLVSGRHERVRKEVDAINKIWALSEQQADVPLYYNALSVFVDPDSANKLNARRMLDGATIQEIFNTLPLKEK